MMVAVKEEVYVKPYLSEIKPDWDLVLDNSINGTFLQRREFMEYHGDRFEDASLIIYQENQPVAIFPAEIEEDKVYSHRGLTYAGWILVTGLTYSGIESVVKETLLFCKKKGVKQLIVRMVPDFFAKQFQGNLKTAINEAGAEVLFTAVHHCTTLPFHITNKGKKWGRNKAIKAGLHIEKSYNFSSFWENILSPNLLERHNVFPTHSLQEIEYLARTFSGQIKLYTVKKGEDLLAGAVIFETDTTVHLQYVAVNQRGRNYKALDYLMTYLIEKIAHDKDYFNMGVSHIPKTGEINKGLVKWKESFGGNPRTVNIYSFILL
jgi:hypothetical protein